MAEETIPTPAAATAPAVPATPETAGEKKAKKKNKKNILNGIVHIQSTFNNTLITFTDITGRDLVVVGWFAWLQGLAQVDPVRGAGCGRRRGSQGDRARHEERSGAGEGSWRRS